MASVLPDAGSCYAKFRLFLDGSAGGYTLKLPLEDRNCNRKNSKDDIAMSLGGYVAEKMIFGDLTTGPSSDLQVATNMAPLWSHVRVCLTLSDLLHISDGIMTKNLTLKKLRKV